MSYYQECPFCGALLDPGERCDCCELTAVPPPEEVKQIRDKIKAQVDTENQPQNLELDKR